MYTMRILRYTVLFLVTIVLASAAGQRYASAAERPSQLRLTSGPIGGDWHAVGNRLATILTRNIAPATNHIGGGIANIAAINTRRADLGLTLIGFLGVAQSGEQEYQSIRAENVALVANANPYIFYFLLRKDVAEKYGITDVASLLQQRIPLRFATLRAGTSTEFILNILLKYGYDTSFTKLREQGWLLEFDTVAEVADNFVAGKIDCLAYLAGTEFPLFLALEEYTEIVVLPIEQKVLDLLTTKFKMHSYTMTPETYKTIPEPVLTLADFVCIIVRKDLPDDLVYEITKTIWENKASLTEAVKDFQILPPKNAVPSDFDIHPGAKKFWDSVQ